MLTSWTLGNFKPVYGPVDLKLGSTTVLAGLNSSGKSSVLQSMLLVAQTLANPNVDRALILNGNVVRLGTFQDILNDRATNPQITLGLEASFAGDRPASPLLRWSRYGDFIRSVRVRASFTGQVQQPGGLPGVEGVKVEVDSMEIAVELPVSPGRESPTRSGHFRVLSDEERAAVLHDVQQDSLSRLPDIGAYANYSVEFQPELRSGVPSRRGHQDYSRVLAGLTHFLPGRLVGEFQLDQREQTELGSIIAELWEGRRPRTPRFERQVAPVLERPIDHDLATGVRALDKRVETPPEEATLDEWIKWARKLKLASRTKGVFTREFKRMLRAHLSSDAESKGSGLEPIQRDLTMELDAAVERLTDFFTRSLRYLGPLRADPQAAKGFAPSSEPDDVGTAGEYAAAVYDANRFQRISWWHPSDKVLRESTLEDAMEAWVRHIGVAHRVSTREAGLSGVSWVITPRPESRERSLSAVGVGVSQVLPILVTGLLAPVGALLLFEQPELHLHAHAQARLGDFFQGLSRAGKQCIIETHSECLVNQFRLHLVSGDLGPEHQIVIYFVEQDEQGDAHFIPVQISDRGNILNWPDGFFDEAVLQEDLITRAGMRHQAFERADA